MIVVTNGIDLAVDRFFIFKSTQKKIEEKEKYLFEQMRKKETDAEYLDSEEENKYEEAK